MYLLPRINRVGSATEAILTGRRIDASEALNFGLASAVVEDGLQGHAWTEDATEEDTPREPGL